MGRSSRGPPIAHPTPSLGGARPAAVSGSAKERMAALRELIPPGPYALVSDAEGSAAGACPPGGSFFWNTRDPDRPVFEIGRSLELPFVLPAEVDETLVLNVEPPTENATPSAGGGEGGFVSGSLTLDRVRSDGRGRTIALRTRPGKGDGASAAHVCHYALGG